MLWNTKNNKKAAKTSFSSGQDELAAEALNPGDKVGPHFADGLETEHQSCCTRCAFACGFV